MIRVFVTGQHTRKGTPTHLSITGVPYSTDSRAWDLFIEAGNYTFRQKLRPETVDLLVKFLHAVEADQDHFKKENPPE